MAVRHLPLQSIGEPEIETEEWFDLSGKTIPYGTPYCSTYKRLCYYVAYNPPVPIRIDHTLWAYTKLLEYFMMRALKMNFETHVTADELWKILPTLQTLVHRLLLQGEKSILNTVDDGRDSD
jgi:hypothetical protein